MITLQNLEAYKHNQKISNKMARLKLSKPQNYSKLRAELNSSKNQVGESYNCDNVVWQILNNFDTFKPEKPLIGEDKERITNTLCQIGEFYRNYQTIDDLRLSRKFQNLTAFLKRNPIVLTAHS